MFLPAEECSSGRLPSKYCLIIIDMERIMICMYIADKGGTTVGIAACLESNHQLLNKSLFRAVFIVF